MGNIEDTLEMKNAYVIEVEPGRYVELSQYNKYIHYLMLFRDLQLDALLDNGITLQTRALPLTDRSINSLVYIDENTLTKYNDFDRGIILKP